MSKPTDPPRPAKLAGAFSFAPGLDLAALPERTLALVNGYASHDEEPLASSGVDLSGVPKVWFVIGRGRLGKTTVVRFAAETVYGRGGDVMCAAADPGNRSLATFLEGVAQPPSNDPATVALWLRSLLDHALTNKASAIIDLGGGDTSLGRLLSESPDLADVMREAGVEPVAIHVLGRDEDDLSPLATMEKLGFRPRATALVMNQMTGVRDQFARVRQHSVYRSAVSRGAVPIWMPALSPDIMQLVNARGVPFTEAGDDLGLLIGAPVRIWIKEMSRQFSPIASWLP